MKQIQCDQCKKLLAEVDDETSIGNVAAIVGLNGYIYKNPFLIYASQRSNNNLPKKYHKHE